VKYLSRVAPRVDGDVAVGVLAAVFTWSNFLDPLRGTPADAGFPLCRGEKPD
jgi:hypothetical protein